MSGRKVVVGALICRQIRRNGSHRGQRTISYLSTVFFFLLAATCLGSGQKHFNYIDCFPIKSLIKEEKFSNKEQNFFLKAGKDTVILDNNNDTACKTGCL
jgi:hypothetical protein